MAKDPSVDWARKRNVPPPADVEAVLAERADSHGDFAECAAVSQGILRALRQGRRWNDLEDYQVEALQMLAHKCHRIVCGDPNFIDHWTDICGYARLVVKELEKRDHRRPE